MRRLVSPSGGSLRLFDRLLIFGTLLVLTGLFIAGCAADDNTGHQHGSMTSGERYETTGSLDEMPRFLDNHTPNTVFLYKQVGEYMDLLSELVCYCGCLDDPQPHATLLRCYLAQLSEEEVVWTDHSTMCGICKMQAEEAIAMTRQGMSTDEIRQAIDEKFKPRNL